MKSYSIAMVAACPFPVNYGSPAAIRELSETLSEMGHDVHVVTYPYGENLSVGSARVHRVKPVGNSSNGLFVGPSKNKPMLDFLLLRKLIQVIREHKIQIIHGHNYEGGLAAIIAKFLTRRPMVWNSVNLMSDELHTYDFIKPRFLANCLAAVLDRIVPIFPNHIIAVTRELYDFHARRVRPERLTLVPCGVRPEMFARADGEKLRQKYNVGSRPVIMYMGVNSAFQRVDYLLRAFKLVLEEESSALLMIVSPIEGDTDLATNVALAKSLGISDNVLFLGPHTLEEMPDYLALATVTVVPRPDCPGHPIKLLNYMMAGKPIVCFAGAAKGVTHMHDALLVPDHDWERMGDAIVTFLRDKQLAARLGANARQTVLENLDWQILAKKVENVYATLI